jgi:alpha-glucan,water dikinase
MLAELRRAIQELVAPDELPVVLRQVMENAGLAWPESWDDAWTCIKRVWASKWNHRAWLSRRARNIVHDDLSMAVLIQQVIEAEYAFVIHTVNPSTGNRDELYAEVVLGLGETLVGNYPGRALSFVCGRKSMQPELLAFPSKSVGLYGSGLIFRSDSNGEDLPGYAGAGLYDSIMLQPSREVVLDYSQERAVWDENFRANLLLSIARLGFAVADAFDSPQDIEGVVANSGYYVVQTRAQTV